MSKDFDYFTEFLADPAKYPFDEFHRLAKEWGRYILDHKDEFNYLEDDEWKEIRERLLGVFYEREHEMNEVEDEWDELCEILENSGKLSDKEKIQLQKRFVQFMKDYQNHFNFKDEDIAELEILIARFTKSARNAELSEMRYRLSKMEHEKSIAEFDEELVRYYERTGKIPRVTTLRAKKKHEGN